MPFDKDFDRYVSRTLEHIHRVQKNMELLVRRYSDKLSLTMEECREAIWNVLNHDRSKFSEKQFGPYIELTKYHDIKRYNKDHEYPSAEIKKAVDEAVEDHYAQENHHPERYRDRVSIFSKVECLEIVCDLQAIAQEFNEGSCRKYFEDVWRKKHKGFQTDDCNYWSSIYLMYIAIDCFENEMNIRHD